jgi:diadenosine tetraphosphate (Ap4A) HIT family hydrolase
MRTLEPRQPGCELCEHSGGQPVWDSDRLRVVLVDDAFYPGFTRVIWTAHVKEMTDLAHVDRDYLMEAVWSVERTQRSILQPDKINLASFGNVVPHLHWHVIPRYGDDRHFPQPVWATPARDETQALQAAAERRELLASYRERLIANMGLM